MKCIFYYIYKTNFQILVLKPLKFETRSKSNTIRRSCDQGSFALMSSVQKSAWKSHSKKIKRF